ncbi:hypothetical protein BV25DRAFT_1843542 [Artomyces pyxidatus]|uniref:Uncharacterized protein n=1 Tax=Artomyces pyxidatus TaxID=48021 RepID=A0ACB8SEE3_9AGAM|nr:hypothetical protein BV25DRAFT_1843542 [Artomyces pyxidatus]
MLKGEMLKMGVLDARDALFKGKEKEEPKKRKRAEKGSEPTIRMTLRGKGKGAASEKENVDDDLDEEERREMELDPDAELPEADGTEGGANDFAGAGPSTSTTTTISSVTSTTTTVPTVTSTTSTAPAVTSTTPTSPAVTSTTPTVPAVPPPAQESVADPMDIDTVANDSTPPQEPRDVAEKDGHADVVKVTEPPALTTTPLVSAVVQESVGNAMVTEVAESSVPTTTCDLSTGSPLAQQPAAMYVDTVTSTVSEQGPEPEVVSMAIDVPSAVITDAPSMLPTPPSDVSASATSLSASDDTAPSNATAAVVVPTAEREQWVRETITFLQDGLDEREWATAVVQWMKLEKLLGFPDRKVSKHPSVTMIW